MDKKEKTDEVLKADESQIVEESPASEVPEVLDQEPKELPIQPESVESPETAVEDDSQGTQEGEGRKTANSRIRELVAEKKEAQQQVEKEKTRADSLAEQMAKFTQAIKPQVNYPASTETANEEGELTVEEVLRRADALTQIRIAQQENLNRINSEAQEAMKKYPELDPDSDNFDPELSLTISKATMANVVANPTESVKGFVDSLIKPYRRSLEKQAAGQKETIAKQVSEQAMRPTQVQVQEKPFAELSIEEMEKKLGVTYR